MTKFSCLLLLTLLLQLLHIDGGHGWSFGPVQEAEDEPGGAEPQPSDVASTANHTILTRQLIVGTLVPPLLPGPWPSPAIVAPGTSYCQCVPPGSCANPLPTVPSDGSGQLDIRIVNTGAYPSIPSTSATLTCSYGQVACCQAGSYQCGRRFPPPLGSSTAGAGQANFGAYPWQAALLTTADVYLGGGALITAQHVLTAAHKVYNLALTSFKVRLGEWDASSTSEPIPAQDVYVSNVYVNPSFNPTNLQNDVAILKLVQAVSLTSKSTVGTICLPTTSFVGQRCWVAGWGKNDFGPTGAYQAIQRQVDVPLIPNANCQAALRATRLGSSFALSPTSFICAGGEAGKDACTGDGGSPLVCTSNGLWYVVGLVAWGIGCAQAGVPGVYVNVGTFLPWIQTTLTL
ncbi:phenoloxidase-activating factor 2 [Drosophila persimilis]|uniref:Phenoloxidase-activating factor 2 n=1 Tax=Drosophila pseudoobscura pseudoobscura TaxID=46245 RepID=A0A6I8URL4_DROPS|nr:phenoloxidase-activating factor 2 [Drosophila pseudoobscura]XP_026850566.1 phenoloxidase-activating factor 2 [Drosophila persimilis]